MLKKVDFEIVSKFLDYVTKTDCIRIIYVDSFMEDEIKEFFFKYKDLTLTDCSLLVLANQLNIKTLYSFDSGFDKVKGIERRED